MVIRPQSYCAVDHQMTVHQSSGHVSKDISVGSAGAHILKSTDQPPQTAKHANAETTSSHHIPNENNENLLCLNLNDDFLFAGD
jgi:hypothetical protein